MSDKAYVRSRGRKLAQAVADLIATTLADDTLAAEDELLMLEYVREELEAIQDDIATEVADD
ncbi:MAG: hypothetical protein QM729_21365 [Solirubrobacterales bacterium]